MTPFDYWRVRHAPPFERGIAKVCGQSIEFSDKTGFLHSVNEIYLEEAYKFRAKRDDPIIIDAGANIGLSVIYFKNIYPKARIIAYEPDPFIFELLERNIARLALPQIDLRNAAAWVEETRLNFFSEGSLAGSTELDFLARGKSSEVPAERLKDVLCKDRVDFLKIDIEGGESRVLFDIEDALENVDHLFFEYHSQPSIEQTLGPLLNLVQRAGFRYMLNGSHCSKFPFIDRVNRGFDLQINVSCFRQH